MRGIRFFQFLKFQFYRLTPARAGNTRTSVQKNILPRAHPRSCGEYWTQKTPRRSETGSPPLMRGIRFMPYNVPWIARLTPARAGNTPLLSYQCPDYWAHPRSCGEYVMKEFLVRHAEGSPPLVRGILQEDVKPGNAIRLTPARAGNTSCSFIRCPRK